MYGEGKCKYAKVCSGYQPFEIINGEPAGVTCNKKSGPYCGTWREFEEKYNSKNK